MGEGSGSDTALYRDVIRCTRSIANCVTNGAMYEANLISYEDALRNADSLNDLRLEIKLHGKEAKGRNVFSGIGNLEVVPEATQQNQF